MPRILNHRHTLRQLIIDVVETPVAWLPVATCDSLPHTGGFAEEKRRAGMRKKGTRYEAIDAGARTD